MRISRVLLWSVRYFNPIARVVLATRFHALMSGRLMLVGFTGRKTGRSYMTPVSYVDAGSSLLVPGGGGWWRSLSSAPRARVLLRGTWREVTSEVITEPTTLAELMQRMLAANPAIALFTGIKPSADGRPDAAALDRERRRGFVVVRIQLEDEAGQAPSEAA